MSCFNHYFRGCGEFLDLRLAARGKGRGSQDASLRCQDASRGPGAMHVEIRGVSDGHGGAIWGRSRGASESLGASKMPQDSRRFWVDFAMALETKIE